MSKLIKLLIKSVCFVILLFPIIIVGLSLLAVTTVAWAFDKDKDYSWIKQFHRQTDYIFRR